MDDNISLLWSRIKERGVEYGVSENDGKQDRD